MVEPGTCPVCGAKPVIEVSKDMVKIRCANYEEETHEVEVEVQSSDVVFALNLALEMWGEKDGSD